MLKTNAELLSPWGGEAKSFSRQLVVWYQGNRKDWPWRLKFAEFGDPYTVWISEIMLQQTTIQAVLPSYHRFLDIFPNVFRLAQASEDAVREACRGLGYYRRFRMMHGAAQLLAAGLRSESEAVVWPRDFASWKELPGIGDYTAAAISSIAFAYPKAVVDGNVERVFARLFNLSIVVDSKWKKVFQSVGDALIPSVGDGPSDFNQGLMELGQSVCIKGNPRCGLCPVSEFCAAFKAGTQNLVPLAKAKFAFEPVRLHLFIQQKRDRIGLVQRTAQARFLKGAWSFPSAIETDDGALVWETFPVPIQGATVLGKLKHSITKYRLELVVSRVAEVSDISEMKWIPGDEIERKLVSNMDRKALQLFLKTSKLTNLESRFSQYP